jgi:hypothetical protein
VIGLCLLLSVSGCSTEAPIGLGGAGTSRPAVSVAGAKAGSGAGAAAPTAHGGSGGGADRPAVLVGIRTEGKKRRDGSLVEVGSLVVLDPLTGSVTRTLDPKLATGDEVQLSPDRSTVFYEKAVGCFHQIWSVPVAGGTPKKIVEGSVPAVSPDGTRLAYATQYREANCAQDLSRYAVRVRSLDGGGTRTLAVPAEQQALPSPVSHLSWSPDGSTIAVSLSSVQDNEGWGLRVVDPGRDRYYVGEAAAGTKVPVGGRSTPGQDAFYRQGVFLPDATMFVVRRCCSGNEGKVSSELLEVVDPATGAVRRKIAVGLLTKDHTSLDCDASGRWLLYLSQGTVMVSGGGAKPVTLTNGYQAVDW